MPPNPPSKAHGFAMRSMSLCDMQISKSEKKILAPPPAKSWGRPWFNRILVSDVTFTVVTQITLTLPIPVFLIAPNIKPAPSDSSPMLPIGSGVLCET